MPSEPAPPASGASSRAREAHDRAQAAVEASPGDGALWVRLADAKSDLGDASGALECLERARACAGLDAATWRRMGLLYAELWRWAEADGALAQAARLAPADGAAEALHAVVKQEMGDVTAAIAGLGRAAARDPGDLHTAVALRLMLPQVYADEADVARWRARYAAGLADLRANVARWLPRAGDVFALNRNNFLLAYQGEDDRELQREYSAFLARLAGAVRPRWREPRRSAFDGGRRLRIGFPSQIFRDCTAGRYFERWITGLDPRRFERFVYHLSPVSDAFTGRIAASAEHFQALREGPLQLAERLEADRLDVIFQPEVGMTPTSYLLAALRLAPLQCAGWGHPVTTGSDAVDLYFTSAPMEPEEGASHYVERLVGLPGLGVDYAMPAPPSPGGRRDLALPEDRRLYVCAQSLFKLHPEMDALFADILEADPEGVLVFFQAPSRAVTEQFAARLQDAMKARGMVPRGQLKFLPRLGGAAFRLVLAVADVVLDTVRWSGGNTSLDAFSAPAPVVTLPGRFMRGRQTAAMLRMMGLERLVARDRADYVRIALEVARDRDTNAGLREAIVRGREALFDRPEPIAALEEALLEAAGSAS